MTRADALAKQKADLEAAIAQKKTKRDRITARLAALDKKDRTSRRYAAGKLAEDAGLLAWNDATLAGLFTVLAQLIDTPEPIATLDSLLAYRAEIPAWIEAQRQRAHGTWRRVD